MNAVPMPGGQRHRAISVKSAPAGGGSIRDFALPAEGHQASQLRRLLPSHLRATQSAVRQDGVDREQVFQPRGRFS
jgi:hypothetical protein